MKVYGIVIKTSYPNIERVVNLLSAIHKKHNVRFYCFEEMSYYLPTAEIAIWDPVQNPVIDAIFVFGGDGTILHAKKYSLLTNAPICGINLGRLGFLSECNMHDFEAVFSKVINGQYHFQHRMLLDVNVKRNSKVIFQNYALNDVVIFKGFIPKMIEVKVYCNRELVYQTRSDGMIASTPTGSTAYSLSAGGPILSPLMEAIVLSPLSPHILTIRPMVFAAEDHIQMKLHNTLHETVLQIDGQNEFELTDEDTITVTSAKRKIPFMKLTKKTFYEVLRKKLYMGKQ